jgi:peptidoglycan hydrolase-like protein with peptidoglycan-binding domain
MLVGQPLGLAQNSGVKLPEPTPTPEETVIDQPQLKIGDQGPLVQQLQFYLKELGLLAEEPNGVFGESTAAAVRSLQSRKGLPVDGVMNTATWTVLMTEYQVNSLDLSTPEGAEVDLPAPTPSPTTEPIDLASPPTPNPSQAAKELQGLQDPNNSSSEGSQASAASADTGSEAEAQSKENAEAASANSLPVLRIILGALALGLGGICLWQLLRLTRIQAKKSTPSGDPSGSPGKIDSVVSAQTLEFVPYAQPPANGTFSTEEVTAITYRVNTDRSGNDRMNTDRGNDRPVDQQSGSSLARSDVTTSELSWRQSLDKVEALIEDLGSNTITQRHQAIWELGQQADGRGIKPLMELFPLADSHEQSLILAAISEIGVKTCKPMKQVLALSLDSPNPEVRKNAIRDLHRLYETILQSSQLIKYALNDPDPEVQETAAWAIEQMARLNQTNIPRQFKPEFQQD